MRGLRASPRTFGLVVLVPLLITFLVSTRIPAWAALFPAHWPLVAPGVAGWIIASWGVLGPLWGAAGLFVFGGAMSDVALSMRQPWLVGACWGLLTGVGLMAAAGHRRGQRQERIRQAACEQEEERANTLRDTVAQLKRADQVLKARLKRYTALRMATDTLGTQAADLDPLLKGIVQQVLAVLDHADLALVYLVEPPRHDLALRAVQWRRATAPAIKGKTGDLFDQWVLRQGQPLLVRDVRRDFRFPQATTAHDGRPLGSLIGAPMISAQRVLGLVRAEGAEVEAFSAEDLRLLGIVADLGAMAIENTRLYLRTSELAMTDDLTGLTVHRYFHERLDEEVARARRCNSPVSVLLIDIDHFKTYNDRYGHAAGDKLLRGMAGLLKPYQGSGHVIARTGGEEFAVLLGGVGRAGARQQAEQIHGLLGAHEVDLRRDKTKVTVSIGVATFPDDGSHKEGLLQVADQRLYRAKAEGRNRVCDT